MSDKTEEQIAADKAALDAMRNARAHMDTALNRVATLERALIDAREALRGAKKFISDEVYRYPVGSERQSCHAWIDEAVCRATKALG